MASRVRALGAALAGAGLLMLGAPWPVLGHALDDSYTLPVPLWLYLWGALAAVAASFIVVVIAEPNLPPPPAGRPLRGRLRLIGSVAGNTLGFVLWFAAVAMGLLGLVHEFLPATLFWIFLWAGMPIVAAVIGNPWPAMSPFRSLLGLTTRLLGRQPDLGLAYPAGLARWPAVALLAIGLIVELTVPGSATGPFVGTLLVAYTVLTVTGMVAFGPVTWLRNAEVFEVLFGWFGRIGPIGRRSTSPDLCRDCATGCEPTACIDCPECVVVGTHRDLTLELRRPLAGLAEIRGAGWSDAAFILLALSGVTFDGLQDTGWWVAWNGIIQNVLAGRLPPQIVFAIAGPVGLLIVWGAFLTLFAGAATLTRALAGAPLSLASTAGRYAATLLPISAGYAIAHYLTLIIQGVASVPGMMLSPAAVEAELNWMPAGFVWYLSVVAIVTGHVAAVLTAHREALRLRANHPAIAELPLVTLMLGYTVVSLWIIGQPITIDVL